MVAQIKKKRKQTPWHRLEGTTNFYPQYLDGARDRVTPIAPVQPNEFQRVEPRYQLSMSETRDTGLGPMFLEVEYPTPEQRANGVVNAKKREEKKEAEPLFKCPVHAKKKSTYRQVGLNWRVRLDNYYFQHQCSLKSSPILVASQVLTQYSFF